MNIAYAFLYSAHRNHVLRMFYIAPSVENCPKMPATATWCERSYLRALHPDDARGCVGVLTPNSPVLSHTLRPEELPFASCTLIEQEAYVSMNRFSGRRAGDRLAVLNAVWLDLDTYRVPELRVLDERTRANLVSAHISVLGLPSPSFTIASGRGLYVIWLIKPCPAGAAPRWSEIMKSLVRLFGDFGADPACVDVARVLRLPMSWHDGVGRQVAVLAGDGARHQFDKLADTIWLAAGRPTRKSLQERRNANSEFKVRSAAPAAMKTGPRGLSQFDRWRAIRRDLARLLTHWGGTVPEGHRDLWLHIHACAAAWINPGANIVAEMEHIASIATPELPMRHVLRFLKPTVRRAERAAVGGRTSSGADPRYSYSGARVADLMSVDAPLADQLGLEQVIPVMTRRQRAIHRRTRSRRSAGALPRSIWLAANPISRTAPWRAAGISRATWYRRRAALSRSRVAAMTARLMAGVGAFSDVRETGPALLYKGEAQQGAIAPEPILTNDSSSSPIHAPNPFDKPKMAVAVSPETISPPGPAHRSSSEAHLRANIEKPTEAVMTAPTIPHDLTKIAANRLAWAELGALIKLAQALKNGATGPLWTLAQVADIPENIALSLSPWLVFCPKSGDVVRLTIPPVEQKATRTPQPRQPELPGISENLGPPPGGKQKADPRGLRAWIIESGITIFRRSGAGEAPARRFIGKLLSQHPVSAVASAVDAALNAPSPVAYPEPFIIQWRFRRKSDGVSEVMPDGFPR